MISPNPSTGNPSTEAPAVSGERRVLLLTTSAEVFTKSARTRRRFERVLEDNLLTGLHAAGRDGEVSSEGRRLVLTGPDLPSAAEVAAHTFGVQRAALAARIPEDTLDDLVTQAARVAEPLVTGRRFAVRVRRRAQQNWRSPDVERSLGTALLPHSAGVDLDQPDVVVRVDAYGDHAYVTERVWEGPGGLPLGTQERSLALLSGGFDSPVAAWMMMRRGSPVDFLHCKLDCAQSDHALVVAYELWRRWGAGDAPLVWILDFQPVKSALRDLAPPRLRQVLLKELMFRAADDVAGQADMPALVTGEAIGQVSSQTLHHLAEIDRSCRRTVLRPLAGFDKGEIIGRARKIGTHDLSARAKEVCNLSDGPVAVAARRETLDRAHARLPEDLVAQALADCRVIALPEWRVGMDGLPVTEIAPDDIRRLHVPDLRQTILAAVSSAGGGTAQGR